MKAINCITVLHIFTQLFIKYSLSTKNFVYQLKPVNFNDKLLGGYRTYIRLLYKLIILYTFMIYDWIKNEYCNAWWYTIYYYIIIRMRDAPCCLIQQHWFFIQYLSFHAFLRWWKTWKIYFSCRGKINTKACDSIRGKSQWTILAYYLLTQIGVFPLNFSRCKTFIDPIVINTN